MKRLMSAEYLKFRIVGKKPKYEKAPLEDEFAAWLRKHLALKYHKEPSEMTIESHIQSLRSAIARGGISAYLTSPHEQMVTQSYYKEFLCEYFSHIILPLLRNEQNRKT